MSRPRWWRPRTRSRRRTLAAGLVMGGLAAYVLLVYVAVVLGGGLLVGRTASPDLGLSVLATAVVALSFEGVGRALKRWAATLAHAGGSPYELLRTFSGTLAGTGTGNVDGDVPVETARLLREGTGAAWVQVWLRVDGRLSLAASCPESAEEHPATAEMPSVEENSAGELRPGRRSVRIQQAGELLGLIVVQERDGVPITSTEERLLAGLADRAAVVLRGGRLRAQLEQRRIQLSLRARELHASRQRLVETQDAERRRLERDIHDGAQQHLVALAVNLRLAHSMAARAPAQAAQLLASQETAVLDTIDTLLSLARGIYPGRLVEEGLAAALRAVGSGSPVPVVLSEESIARYPVEVEAAAYFCCLEALQNAVKHSGGSEIRVALRQRGDTLVCVVADDGLGLDLGRVAAGSGFANMRDRVEAVGGRIWVRNVPHGGTRVQAIFPAMPEGGG